MDKALSWIESEPIIARVGPAVGLIVAYLFARGVIDSDTEDLVLGLLGLVLGTGGIASARAAVVPTIKLPKQQAPDDSSGRHAS